MKRIVGVDVDGVLADFNTAFIDLVIRVTGKDLFPPRSFDIPCWAYPAHYGYTREEETAVWAQIQVSVNFWQNLPVYEDTEDAIKYLRTCIQAMDDVYFITSRPGLTAKVQTERWLRHKGIGTPTVLITGKKGWAARTLGLDVYIDDRYENAIDVAQWSPTTKMYLMQQPWNIGHEGPAPFTRVDTVVGI